MIIEGHPISYRRSYRGLLFKILTLCVFEPPFGGLGATYDVHVRFIGKHVVYFLLVLVEFFSLDVTADALRAKIDRKLAGGSVSAKFSRTSGRPPSIIFLHG